MIYRGSNTYSNANRHQFLKLSRPKIFDIDTFKSSSSIVTLFFSEPENRAVDRPLVLTNVTKGNQYQVLQISRHEKLLLKYEFTITA